MTSAVVLITEKVWSQIRTAFTEEEKQQLTGAICGETICPRGFSIDASKLDQALVAKLEQHKKGLAR